MPPFPPFFGDFERLVVVPTVVVVDIVDESPPLEADEELEEEVLPTVERAPSPCIAIYFARSRLGMV